MYEGDYNLQIFATTQLFGKRSHSL